MTTITSRCTCGGLLTEEDDKPYCLDCGESYPPQQPEAAMSHANGTAPHRNFQPSEDQAILRQLSEGVPLAEINLPNRPQASVKRRAQVVRRQRIERGEFSAKSLLRSAMDTAAEEAKILRSKANELQQEIERLKARASEAEELVTKLRPLCQGAGEAG